MINFLKRLLFSSYWFWCIWTIPLRLMLPLVFLVGALVEGFIDGVQEFWYCFKDRLSDSFSGFHRENWTRSAFEHSKRRILRTSQHAPMKSPAEQLDDAA